MQQMQAYMHVHVNASKDSMRTEHEVQLKTQIMLNKGCFIKPHALTRSFDSEFGVNFLTDQS